MPLQRDPRHRQNGTPARDDSPPTAGVDFMIKILNVDGVIVKLQVCVQTCVRAVECVSVTKPNIITRYGTLRGKSGSGTEHMITTCSALRESDACVSTCRTLTSSIYKGTHALLLTYDITDAESFRGCLVCARVRVRVRMSNLIDRHGPEQNR
jgi:GTPase SAR1 family protein